MRFLLGLLAVSCWLSVVSAQWLETTIPLSIAPIRLVVNTVHSKVYCFGDDALVEVIDAGTNAVTAQLCMTTYHWGLCYNPTVDRVYCEDMYKESVFVFDGGTDSLVRAIPVSIDPEALYCDPVANKVYSLRTGWPGSFDVIDCSRDSVIAQFWANCQLDQWLETVYSDPEEGLLYGVGEDTVFVASTEKDSVIASIPLNGAFGPFCHDPLNHKAFCAASDSELAVLDCQHHEVIKALGVAPHDMCWNAVNGKLYAGLEYSAVAVVNRVTDSVERLIFVGGSPSALCCDTVRNKVYCAGAEGGVAIISGATGSVLKTIAVGLLPWDIAWVPAYGRTYVANYMDGSVSVIRDTGAPAVADVPSGEEREAGAPTLVRGVLFLQNGDCTGERSTRASVGLSPFCALLDISGRKVLDLHPGANDVRALAPGVYFVAEHGSRCTVRARKLVVTK